MNCLRTLLNRLADAASYWLQTPFDAADELWLNQPPRDGADRLAEREAEEEVWEPHSPSTSVVVSTEDHCDAFRAKALRDIHQRLRGISCRDTVVRIDVRFLNTSAAPDIRSSVDAADGPRGTAAQPETRAGHPNPQ
jgi:hypothetical protein